MAKKFFALFFILIFSFLFISNRFTSRVQGQTDTPTPTSTSGIPILPQQKWRCLKVTQNGGKTKLPPKEVDLTISGSGFPTNYDIYIVLCKITQQTHGGPQKYRCTTGNAEYDRLLFGANLTGSISPLTIQVPKGATTNKKQQTADGNLNVTVHMNNPEGHRNYSFYGVTINEVTTTEPTLASGSSASTLQYGTFQMGQGVSQDPQKCVSIRWDPYGRVFDSKSLEPMEKVRVTLLDQNKQQVFVPGLYNPQTTERDGLFNFQLGAGTYYLQPRPPVGYTFTPNPQLHPNYAKAYSDLYKPDDPITEAADETSHRDIPLDPGSNPPFHSAPKIMDYEVTNLGAQTKYEGFVSHPLSIVILVGKKTKKEYARVTSDEFGAWEMVVDNNSLPQKESLTLKSIKVDITTLSFVPYKRFTLLGQIMSFIFQKVSAQDTTTTATTEEESPTVEPIFTYIEGYAYDKAGKVIPNATVKIKLDMSDGVYYQTTTDANGFFTVAPVNLPMFTYYLEFTPPNSTAPIVMTTSEFAQKNDNYLTKNNINLISATKNGQSLIPTLAISPTSTVVQTNLPNPGGPAQSSYPLLLTVIILVFLVVAAGGIMIYIKKKESQSNNLPQQ